MLTAISVPPAQIDAFSTSSDGQLFGLAKGPRTFRLYSTGISEIPTQQTGNAFDVGHAVRLTVAKLAWDKTPLKMWDVKPRLTTNPPVYPLFYSGLNGVGFSFDILRTLAMDMPSNELFIGTEGGLFRCPGKTRDSSVVELASTCQFEYRTHDTDQEFLVGVHRIRLDRSGQPWVRLDPSGSIWRRDDAWVRDDSGGPFQATNIEGVDVQFLLDKVKIGNNLFTESNNAWWPDRHPFRRIVDSVYDDDDGILWLCDRASALFALKLDRLKGQEQ